MYMQAESGELGLSEVEKLSSVARSVMAGPDSIARKEGEYFVAVEPNAFGLPAIDSCPGRTDYCALDCYGIDSERRTATHLKLVRNLEVLEEAETVEGMTDKLRTLMSSYVDRSDRLDVPEDSRNFRIHWDGDFFSVDYAKAWRTVIKENPGIRFWAYTRTYQPDLNIVPVLADLENLDLFLSVDWQNVDAAQTALQETPEVRVAYLVDYSEDANKLIEKLGRDEFRHLACPENMRDEDGKRKLPVISARGGACTRCTYCIDKPNNWDVIFVKEGYEQRDQRQLPIEVPIELSTRLKRTDKVAQPVGGLAIESETEPLF